MNRPALISDTDKLPLETVSDAERRSNDVRFSEIGICHILNFYPDLACMFRDGNVTHMNRSGAALLGLKSATEALGYRLADLLVPEFSDVADEIVSQMLDENEPLSARMRTGTGQAFSVQMTAQWARTIDDGAFVLCAQDITHRLELLEEIKRSGKNFAIWWTTPSIWFARSRPGVSPSSIRPVSTCCTQPRRRN